MLADEEHLVRFLQTRSPGRKDRASSGARDASPAKLITASTAAYASTDAHNPPTLSWNSCVEQAKALWHDWRAVKSLLDDAVLAARHSRESADQKMAQELERAQREPLLNQPLEAEYLLQS